MYVFTVLLRSDLEVQEDSELRTLWSLWRTADSSLIPSLSPSGADTLWGGTVWFCEARSNLRRSHSISWMFKNGGVGQKDNPLESELISASEDVLDKRLTTDPKQSSWRKIENVSLLSETILCGLWSTWTSTYGMELPDGNWRVTFSARSEAKSVLTTSSVCQMYSRHVPVKEVM